MSACYGHQEPFIHLKRVDVSSKNRKYAQLVVTTLLTVALPFLRFIQRRANLPKNVATSTSRRWTLCRTLMKSLRSLWTCWQIRVWSCNPADYHHASLLTVIAAYAAPFLYFVHFWSRPSTLGKHKHAGERSKCSRGAVNCCVIGQPPLPTPAQRKRCGCSLSVNTFC